MTRTASRADTITAMKKTIVEFLRDDPDALTFTSKPDEEFLASSFEDGLGFDSLDRAELLMMIEERFDLEIPTDQYNDTVDQLKTPQLLLNYLDMRGCIALTPKEALSEMSKVGQGMEKQDRAAGVDVDY